LSGTEEDPESLPLQDLLSKVKETEKYKNHRKNKQQAKHLKSARKGCLETLQKELQDINSTIRGANRDDLQSTINLFELSSKSKRQCTSLDQSDLSP
jgi:hypothetical protein